MYEWPVEREKSDAGQRGFTMPLRIPRSLSFPLSLTTSQGGDNEYWKKRNDRDGNGRIVRVLYG